MESRSAWAETPNAFSYQAGSPAPRALQRSPSQAKHSDSCVKVGRVDILSIPQVRGDSGPGTASGCGADAFPSGHRFGWAS